MVYRLFITLGVYLVCSCSLAEEADEQKTAFSSNISVGRMVKAHENLVSYSYYSAKTNYHITSSSNTTAVSSRVGEYEFKTSTGVLNYQYGINDKFNVGLGLWDDFSNTTQFTFTSSAKASGYTDSYNTRSGLRDPILQAGIILKERYDFRLYLQGNYSPKFTERTKSNVVNGGASGELDLVLIKSFDDLELAFSFGYLTYGVRTQPSDSGSVMETSGGNILTARLGVNFFLSTDVSVVLQMEKSMTDLATTKYSDSANSTDMPSYSVTTNYLGLQMVLMDDFSFNVKYMQMVSDQMRSVTGSSVLILDPSSFSGYSLGFNYYF